jgi:glycosyltransferase involved in cell wall biosynthesis
MYKDAIGILINSLVPGGAEMQALLLAVEMKKANLHPVILGLSGGGLLEDLLKKENIDYRILNFNLTKFHKNNRSKLIEVWKVSREFTSAKIGTIISLTYYPNVVGNISARLGCIKRRYWFQVGVEWYNRNSKVEKLAAKFANGFIANSNDASRFVSGTYNVSIEKVHVLPNMYFNRAIINSPEFWRTKLKIKDYQIVIGLFSNFFPVKDHETAVKALAILVKEYKHVKMVFAGYAPEICNIYKTKALAYDLDLHENLTFTDSTHDVQGLLSVTDICLFTSLKQHTEGSPNIILDYMLAKKPIVASNIGPINDLFEGLDKSFLYEPENANDLAEKLSILIKNSLLRKELGDANYRNVLIKHDKKYYADFVQKLLVP